MAVTSQESIEYKAMHSTTPPVHQPPHVQHGRLRVANFVHDQVGLGDAGSSVAAVKLPPGNVRLLGFLSNVYVNWTTALQTMDVGWDAYTDLNGNAVAADPNGLDAAVDVDAVGVHSLGTAAATLATARSKVFSSRSGVTIRFTAALALVAGDDLAGQLVFVVD